jgi:glucose-6-phosphate 1-dehydrogenase
VTAKIIPVDIFDLVVFGGTGDLARRKLMPGLYYRDRDQQLPAESRIIGVARRELERDVYVEQVEAALRRQVAAADLDEACLDRFLGRLRYLSLDVLEPSNWITSRRNRIPSAFRCSTSPPRPSSSGRSAGASPRATSSPHRVA